MGIHHAPQSSSHAARLAGRGAFTAAATLALAGGTASLAFATEAPSTPHVDTASASHQVQDKAADGQHQVQDKAAAGQEKVTDLASSLPTSLPSGLSADSVTSHAPDVQEKVSGLQGKASDVEKKVSAAAAPVSSKLPVSVPTADMVTDAGHAVSNTKNDVEHAQYNLSGAMKEGMTPASALHQTDLVTDDVQHAVDNGKNDAMHWTSSATKNVKTPAQLGSVLSFA